MKKNIVYLNLDDLQKLYGLSPKLLKKLKKKRKKRKKGQKGIKFDKIKDSQMPGVQYQSFKNNNSNLDTQFLKDQIKSIEDKQNKLLITDVQPNMVNNKLLMDLKQDNANIKTGLVKMYNDAGSSYNYTYDAINELQSSIKSIKNNLTDPFYKKSGNFTVNTRDNIGDFSNNNNLSDPNQKEEDKQTYNRLSQISEEIETPSLFTNIELSSLFYDEVPDVMQPNTEQEKPEVITENITEDLPDETLSFSSKKDRVTSEKNHFSDETASFIEEEKEIINDKLEFVTPTKLPNEDGRTYKGRVEYERKKFYGEPIRADQRRRYEPKTELFE